MWTDSWSSLLRIITVGVLTYAGMVFLLRISGNRTLSKMNSFDLVVTVAFGSTLSSVLIDRKIPLADGLVAIALLIALQFAVTWLSVRLPRFNQLVKTRPTLLVRDGQLRPHALREVRVTSDEIMSALRQHGIGDLQAAAAVVMESDGSLSVIRRDMLGSGDTLDSVIDRPA